MKYFMLMVALTMMLCGGVEDKRLGKTSKDASGLLLANEIIIEEHYGDFNNDGIDDILLIVEETNPQNIIVDEGDGYTLTKNYNNRHLIIAFKDSNGYYRVKCVNTKGFIPSYTQRDNENFIIESLVSITNKGTIKVGFWTMMSAGGWGSTSSTYIFRFQEDDFYLIGSENLEWHRASGIGSNVSTNYLTSEKIITTQMTIIGDVEVEEPVSKKVKFPRSPLVKLSEIDYFDAYAHYAWQ